MPYGSAQDDKEAAATIPVILNERSESKDLLLL